MDGNTTHSLRRITALAVALAATLLVIPLASAGRLNSQPARDGWYYTVLSAGKARVASHDGDGWYYNVLRAGEATLSAAGNDATCQANHSYQWVARAGELPAIVAALHGGGAVTTGPGPHC
jgi:hypothetical protein